MFSEISLRISQEVGSSYLLYRVERAAAARDGKPSDAAMAAAMAGTEILYIARPDGVLSRIDGLRAVSPAPAPDSPQRGARGAGKAAEREPDREPDTRRLVRNDRDPLRPDPGARTRLLLRLCLADRRRMDSVPDARSAGPWETTKQGRRLRLQLAYVADAQAEVPAAIRLRPKVATTFAPGGRRQSGQGLHHLRQRQPPGRSGDPARLEGPDRAQDPQPAGGLRRNGSHRLFRREGRHHSRTGPACSSGAAGNPLTPIEEQHAPDRTLQPAKAASPFSPSIAPTSSMR